jgi:hypothetical protein
MRIGKDTGYIFLDTDGNQSTGFHVEDKPIGAEYMIHISGRLGYIFNRTLNKFTGGNRFDWKWMTVDSVSVGNDGERLETQVPFDLLGLAPSYSGHLGILYYLQNWFGDSTDTSPTRKYEINPLPENGNISNDSYSQLLRRHTRSYHTIDTQDNSLTDWDNVTTTYIDDLGETTVKGCDLTLVSFAVDTNWLYIRWDVQADGFTNPAVLYDIGINRSGTGGTFDVYCAAEITPGKSGNPDTLSNVSVREYTNKDVYVWNWTDDGFADDGELLLGQPDASRNSVEARFPLSEVALTTDVIIGRFRSHPSNSVNSVVKDFCPDPVRFFKYNITSGAWGVVTNPTDPLPAFFSLNKTSNLTSAFRGWSVQWQIQFNNIGENVSKAVWINETLPFNMTFQDDNSTQCSIDFSGDGNNITRTIIGWTANGYEIIYKFSNVTVGNHSFVINCTVNDTAVLDNYLIR